MVFIFSWIFIYFHGFRSFHKIFMDFDRISMIFMDFHRFSLILLDFHFPRAQRAYLISASAASILRSASNASGQVSCIYIYTSRKPARLRSRTQAYPSRGSYLRETGSQLAYARGPRHAFGREVLEGNGVYKQKVRGGVGRWVSFCHKFA